MSELYSVPITGGVGIKLNGLLVPGRNVVGSLVSPNGERVVYKADQQTDNVFGLYSVPIGGPASAWVKLNGPLPPEGDVMEYDISSGGGRVVYRADQQTNDVFELYSVPIEGPASKRVRLNGTLVADGDVQGLFLFSPDGRRVVYRADQDTDEVFELYVTDEGQTEPYVVYLPLTLRD